MTLFFYICRVSSPIIATYCDYIRKIFDNSSLFSNKFIVIFQQIYRNVPSHLIKDGTSLGKCDGPLLDDAKKSHHIHQVMFHTIQ